MERLTPNQKVVGTAGAYPQSCANARDSSLCGGSQRTEPVWRLCNRPLGTFARPFPIIGLYRTQRWQVAAALSAAATTTKPIGDIPHAQAEPSQKKQPPQTPAALRERGSGGEALLSEKRPLPQNLPPIAFPGGSAREGPFAERPPPSHPTLRPYFSKEATVWVFSKSKAPVSVLAFLM